MVSIDLQVFLQRLIIVYKWVYRIVFCWDSEFQRDLLAFPTAVYPVAVLVLIVLVWWIFCQFYECGALSVSSSFSWKSFKPSCYLCKVHGTTRGDSYDMTSRVTSPVTFWGVYAFFLMATIRIANRTKTCYEKRVKLRLMRIPWKKNITGRHIA